MPISDNELIRELVTGGMDERAAKALLTRLSAASSVVMTLIDYAHPATAWSDEPNDHVTFQIPTEGIYTVIQTGNSPHIEWDTGAGLLSAAGVFGATPADIGSTGVTPTDGTGIAVALTPDAPLPAGSCLTIRKPNASGSGNLYAQAAWILGPAAPVFVEDPTSLPLPT